LYCLSLFGSERQLLDASEAHQEGIPETSDCRKLRVEEMEDLLMSVQVESSALWISIK
jgi:hypothetical protein